jgi:autotransporter-associated beta strand protein
MSTFCRSGRKSRTQKALFTAVSAALGTACSVGHAGVTLNEVNNTDWTITDTTTAGTLTAVFDPQDNYGAIDSISLGSSGNMLYPGGGTSGSLDQELAGTPFGAGTQTYESQVGPGGSYVDVWTNVASTGTTVNPITFAFHYVLFANDPTIYCYEVLNHSATDPATSVGQGQFLFRSNPSLFPNLYQINTGPNQLGTANAQTTTGVPSTNSNFSTVTAQAGRSVQNVTYDLTGSGIAGDNGTNFFTKYDYSVYTQFYKAETMYGSNYAVTEVDPSTDTLTGGPTKQELAWTDPGILNMEFLSDHYGIDGSGSGAYPGYAYYPTQGVATTRLFGPYGFTISSISGTNAATINQNAINAISNDQAEFATDSELVASGYVPNSSRGTVQIQAANSAGWSSNTTNNTVVLSEPGVNMQESTQGYEYCGQLSQTGAVTISNVVPGTYRMTLYQLGQWGETRVDGVQVQNGQVTIPQNVTFTPENFSPYAPIWTIGTPNRSANEFMNGHTSSGTDLRQYYGAYDFWAEEAALGTPGYVSYNATATVIGGVAEPATNNPNDWIANQWETFAPGLYDSSNGTSDNYNNTCPAYVTAGGGPQNYHGSAWQVHFEVTSAQEAQGQYVVLSVGLVAMDASLVVTLNGHSETWGYNNFSVDDPMLRSGDAGFYQWAAFQFPTSDLNAVGTDNEFTFGVSAHTDGVMYDALRMEITNTSASPSTTGWDDYTYINGGSSTAPNDAFSIPTLTWTNAGGSGNGTTWDISNNQNWSTGVAESTFSNGANVVFNDSNNNHYNVTLNTTVSPNSVLVNNSSGNYVISGTGSIAGSGTLAKYGTGTLTLETANTYTGATTVNAGALDIQNGGALADTSVTVSSGAALQIQGAITATAVGLTLNGTGITTNGALENVAGNNTYSGLITLGSNSTIGSDAGTLTLSNTGTITGSGDNLTLTGSGNGALASVIGTGTGTLTKSGSGTWTLTGANTYTGATSVSAGALNIQSAGALADTSSVTVSGGAALQLQGGISTTNPVGLTLNGTGIATNGALENVSGNNTYSGLITLGSNSTIGSDAGTLTLGNTGTITGSGDNLTLTGSGNGTLASVIGTNTGTLTKSGSGIWTLTGANTFTGGTVVNAGTLVVGVKGALSDSSVSITGGTLQLGTGTGLAQMTSLSITGNGVLDVNDDHVIITYGSSDPISTIAGYIKSGYNGGGWNGTGIISTAARTPTDGLYYGVGFADGIDGIVSGLSSGQIEVMYTLLGDANLDGVVNGEDFTILASNFNQPVTRWDQGDFNYDGTVNGEDFTLLAANFNQETSGAASAGDVAALDAFAAANGLPLSVPEPASAAIMVMAGLGILRRRRRSSAGPSSCG